ncbi:unnamed protein product [Caenorhabditis auriculariae]|uniref:Uncharacterized protein n=1 Tax=Caenorhabditis auriculariae TaxID=2777116 RepID=A0A8S1HFQ4_9PELO|nr:unnamed protein product [Caenorhabditis auriculariae]
MTTKAVASTSTSSQKWAAEKRPPPMPRRDDRLRCINSFDEITESEEEEDVPERPTNSSARSPYAVYERSLSLPSRSNSLPHNQYISPKTTRRWINRFFSDPVMRRKTSLPILGRHISDDDLLGLPPIPEATSPSAPSIATSSSTNNPEDVTKDDDA